MTGTPNVEVPTSTQEMLRRTRRRAEQLRRRRRGGFAALAAAVVAAAVAVPLALAGGGQRAGVVQVIGAPPAVPGSTTPATTRTAPSRPVSGPPATSSITSPTTPTSATTATSAIPATTATSARAVSGSASASSVSPPTTPAVATSPPVVPACTTTHLGARLTDPSGAAGSIGYQLLLVNTGRTRCALGGYPGVSYVTGARGTTIGMPARRDAIGAVTTIILAPGRAAGATLIETDALNYPPETCRLTVVAGLRIYPPDQTASLFVAQRVRACANPADPVLQIGPVGAGD